MDILNGSYLYGEVDKKKEEGSFRFNKGKFGEYSVIKPLEKNRGDADLYLLEENGEKYQLTLYKQGVTAPRGKLLQLQDLSNYKGNNLANLIQCGFSEEYERDYSITRVSEFGSIRDRRIRNYKRLIKQVTKALETCHKNDVIHYDLRPEDIIIENINPNNYVVYGFGHNSLVEELSKEILEIRGLGKYQAPEIAHCKGRKKSDFWSLGVILYEVIVGRYPFECTQNNFGNYDIKFTSVQVPDYVEERYRKLIEGLLTTNTRQRWGLEEVKEWLIYDTEDNKYKETFQTEKFMYKDVEYDGLEDLHEKLAYTPVGYGELEKLYFRGHITKWLADTNNYDLLKKLEENLVNKYRFNSYIYRYTSEERELYFKGYDLTKFENLKMLTETDVNKLIEFIPPLKQETKLERERMNNNTELKLANKNRIDKTYFFYGYVDNRDLYLEEKKASTLTQVPDFDIHLDKNIINYLKLKGEVNYDSVDNYLRTVLNKDNIMNSLKEGIITKKFQLKLLNNNIIEEAHSYIEFGNNIKGDTKDELVIFKKLYSDYQFLNLPFCNLLIEKKNLEFYRYFVEKSYGTDYLKYYDKTIKVFTEETLLKYFSYRTPEEILERYPELSGPHISTGEYIKFQLEILEYISKNKLYLNEKFECILKTTGINKLFKKLIGK